jgi:hypothetical protein
MLTKPSFTAAREFSIPAVSHFRRALRVDGYDAELNYWMGRAYQERGDVARSLGGGYNFKTLVSLRRGPSLWHPITGTTAAN